MFQAPKANLHGFSLPEVCQFHETAKSQQANKEKSSSAFGQFAFGNNWPQLTVYSGENWPLSFLLCKQTLTWILVVNCTGSTNSFGWEKGSRRKFDFCSCRSAQALQMWTTAALDSTTQLNHLISVSDDVLLTDVIFWPFLGMQMFVWRGIGDGGHLPDVWALELTWISLQIHSVQVLQVAIRITLHLAGIKIGFSLLFRRPHWRGCLPHT